MIKVNIKHKKDNENIVYGTIDTSKANQAELMVVIGKLAEVAMKDFDISKMEMIDFIKKRG